MINLKTIHKKIGIFGLGVTGISICKYILRKYNDINLICFDENPKIRQAFVNNFPNIVTIPLKNPLWRKRDMIFVSPGIPGDHYIFNLSNSIPIRSDIDLFYSENYNSEFICITGTNGKTTTIHLLKHIFQAAKLNFAAGGNGGEAVLTLEQNKDIYLLEISSFQARFIKELKPKISVLLNIFTNHLNIHKSLKEYATSKKSLLDKSQIKIIGLSDNYSKQIFEYYKIQNRNSNINLISFTDQKTFLNLANVTILDNVLSDRFLDFQDYYFVNKNTSVSNNTILTSYILTKLLNIDTNICFNSLNEFIPPQYRLQFLGKKNSISFYNDSKSTNSTATYFAISSLKEPILLIIGGIFKEKNLLKLESVLHKINKVFIIGLDTKIFEDFFTKYSMEYIISTTLEVAFYQATQHAKNFKKINILLSPSAASFDQFNGFEHRGRIFTNLVNKFFDE